MSKSSTLTNSNRRRRRASLRGWLEERDLEAVRRGAEADLAFLSTLIASIMEPHDLLRWRAIEALGAVAEDLWRSDPPKLQDLVRRQLWAMNDESGGIAWYGAETIGELLSHAPPLASDFISILASFADIFPFRPGVFWSLAHLAGTHPNPVSAEFSRLIEGLGEEDATIRHHALRALTGAAPALTSNQRREAREQVTPLLKDQATVRCYDFQNGAMVTHAVDEAARAALGALTE